MEWILFFVINIIVILLCNNLKINIGLSQTIIFFNPTTLERKLVKNYIFLEFYVTTIKLRTVNQVSTNFSVYLRNKVS